MIEKYGLGKQGRPTKASEAFSNLVGSEMATILVVTGLRLAGLALDSIADAQSGESPDAFDAVVPPTDGKTLEGTVLEEADIAIDELDNTRLDLMLPARAPEPLPAGIEGRLNALSAKRGAFANKKSCRSATITWLPSAGSSERDALACEAGPVAAVASGRTMSRLT